MSTNNEYMRLYMRRWRAKRREELGEKPARKEVHRVIRPRVEIHREPKQPQEYVVVKATRTTERTLALHAKYDPKRDGPVRYASPQDEFMGDPPIGRRAIDQQVER